MEVKVRLDQEDIKRLEQLRQALGLRSKAETIRVAISKTLKMERQEMPLVKASRIHEQQGGAM